MGAVANVDASRRTVRGVLDAALSKGSLYGHIKGHRHAVAAPGSPCDVLRNRHLPQKSLKGAGGG